MGKPDMGKLDGRGRMLLHLADNGLVMSHRLSEWCARAPELELEMGLANIALDHLGQARLWYGLLGQAHGGSEDDWAYWRDESEYLNLQLLEQPNENFAMTVAKMFLYDCHNGPLLTELADGKDGQVAAVAAKAALEAKYHLRFSGHWMKVMVGGTGTSRRLTREALDYLWQFCGEMFAQADFEQGFVTSPASARRDKWLASVIPVLAPLEMDLGTGLDCHPDLGKHSRHSEHLGPLLAEMQVLARKHEGVRW